jgi:predicted kinase
VIIDATFLKRWQRQLFRDLASESGIRFTIVDFVAATATLRDRIAQRLLDPHEASDADLAILEHQVQMQEQLAPDELDDTVLYDAQRALAEARLPESWHAVLDRLAAAPAAELSREFATGSCRSAAAGTDRPPADRPGA